MKKLLSLALVAMIMISALAAPALSAASDTIFLKGDQKGNFNETWNDIFYLGGAEDLENPQKWHIVYSEDVGSVSYMQLDFGDNGLFVWNKGDGFSTNGGDNNPGWVVYAPTDWELVYANKGNNNESDSFVVASNGGQFNISGYSRGTPPAPPADLFGELRIAKTVGGEALDSWFAGLGDVGFSFEDVICGMVFYLYAIEDKGAAINDPPYATGVLDLDGVIKFSKNKIATGWYAVVEELSGLAAEIFEEVGPQYFYVTAVKTGGATEYLAGGGGTFDYNAFYTIVNGYGSGYTLGYPGLNNNGDIFPIAVKNAGTGAVYPSFCFNAGSRAFAGESGLGCSGYMVAERMDKVAKFEDFLSAYNYIEDKCGGLDDNRAIAQIMTWHLLGSIEIPSAQFDGINWAAIESGTGAVKGIADAKATVENVAANYKGYVGEGTIIDIAVMLCELDHPAADCQPQLVPIYDSGTFDNSARPGKLAIDPAAAAAAELTIWTQKYIERYERERSPYKYVSQGYSSVTATNAGVKTNIVANSNHFAFAKLPKTDLAEGIALDMVVGNKVDTCGSAFAKMVDGKLEITIDDAYKSSFGAVAFDGFIPTVKNGNIHSTGIFSHGGENAIDVYNTGSFQSSDKKGANYDKDWADLIKNVKVEAGYVYLYIHGDFTFDLTASVNPGAGYEYDEDNNLWWGPWSKEKLVGEEASGVPTSRPEGIKLEIAITVTFEDGTEVYSGTYMPGEPAIAIDGLKFGEYTVTWSWAYPGGDPASDLYRATVDVKPGKTAEFAMPGGISITQVEVEKSYEPGTQGVYDAGLDNLVSISKTTLTVSTVK